MDKSFQSIEELNAIAGGGYWQDIINQYKAGTIDGYEAEARFSEQYCQRLRQSYKYVLNMPLRIKKGQRPKYKIDSCNKSPRWLLTNFHGSWEKKSKFQMGGLWETGGLLLFSPEGRTYSPPRRGGGTCRWQAVRSPRGIATVATASKQCHST